MKNVQDIYPLTPMQESMLLHSVSRPTTDVLFSQFCYEIEGSVSLAQFQRAWALLTERHPVLRTAFFWSDLKQPVQVVHKSVNVPFEFLDWRNNSHTQQQQLLLSFREQDRQTGFDFTKAPLTRLTLISFSDTRQYFVWTTHHLLLDRWCIAPLHSELRQIYFALLDDRIPRLPQVVPYRRYIDWLQARSLVETKDYWQRYLNGFTKPTLLTAPIIADQSSNQANIQSYIETNEVPEYRSELCLQQANNLRMASVSSRVTTGVILQAAWALTISHYTRRADIVFGVTSTGRPSELAGVNAIMGSFINNLPIRIKFDPDVTLGEWLRALQSDQQSRANFESVSTANLHQYSNLTDNSVLYDSLLVWLSSIEQHEDPGDDTQDDRLIMRGIPEKAYTAYPLTISVTESGQTLLLDAQLASGYASCLPVKDLLDTLLDAIDILTQGNTEDRLGDLIFKEARLAIAIPDDTQEFSINNEKNKPEMYSDVKAVSNLISNDALIEGRSAAREQADRSFMEELLRSEWQAVLGSLQFGDDDNFFDLGGTSINAATLHANLEACMRSTIPLLALFSNPTFGQMVISLIAKDWPMKPDILIPVNSYGDEATLFCIASPEVNTLGYSQLSRNLPTARPVYVLQAPPDHESMRRLSPQELPKLAVQYVQAMRSVQPEGPYNLLGMCTGSQIALEMVRYLETLKEKTDFVGIINTWALYTVSPLYHLNRLHSRVNALRNMPANQRLSAIRQRLFTAQRTIATYPDAGPSNQVQPGSLKALKPMSEAPVDEWIDVYGWRHLNPKQQRVTQRVTVFRIASQPYWRSFDRSLGWKLHANSVDIVELASNDHHALMRLPSVKDLAKKVDEALKR